MFIINITAR